MNIKELEKIRHEILKQIKDEMTAEFFAVHLNKKDFIIPASQGFNINPSQS